MNSCWHVAKEGEPPYNNFDIGGVTYELCEKCWETLVVASQTPKFILVLPNGRIVVAE